MCNKENLPGLEQALEMLQEIEKKVDEGIRIAQTRRALEKNERITQNKKVVEPGASWRLAAPTTRVKIRPGK